MSFKPTPSPSRAKVPYRTSENATTLGTGPNGPGPPESLGPQTGSMRKVRPTPAPDRDLLPAGPWLVQGAFVTRLALAMAGLFATPSSSVELVPASSSVTTGCPHGVGFLSATLREVVAAERNQRPPSWPVGTHHSQANRRTRFM